MEFGLLNELQPGTFDQGPEEARQREQQVYFESAEQTILAEELGFDCAWVVEHHFLNEHSASSAPECWLAWMAGQTERIRLGHGVVQLSKPINHVMRVAERAAVVDIVSNGRLEFGSGRGFTHDEVATFGIHPDQTRPMQLEAMRILPDIWNEEEFEYHSEFYDIPKRRLTPRPVQKPHPPLWMAASQPDTWKIAGEMGQGVLAFGFAQPGLLEQCIGVYREAIKTAQPKYGQINDRVGFAPLFYCADTDKEALETAAPYMAFYLQIVFGFIMGWAEIDSKDYGWYREVQTELLKVPELTDEEKAGLSEGAQMIKAGVKAGIMLVGSPETCREAIERADGIGINQTILQAQIGRLPHKQVMDSLRLFAAEVMPHFKQTS